MKKPISHRAYLVTGAVVSGWLFFFPGMIKLPDHRVRQWDAVQIPEKQLRLTYLGLEIIRRIKKAWGRG